MRRPLGDLTELITGSMQPPSSFVMSTAQRALYLALPPDYRKFLERHNGGRVSEFSMAFDTGVPFRTKEVDNPSRNDGVRELFGLRHPVADDDAPSDLVERRACYDAEEFLPQGVIAIARCTQSSLVCLSLRRDDFGQVYYWDWYWQYPWCRWFFDERLRATAKRYPDAKAIAADPKHKRHQELKDAFNYATIVRLAPSFSAWLSQCYCAGMTR
jgi:hypothetical protein